MGREEVLRYLSKSYDVALSDARLQQMIRQLDEIGVNCKDEELRMELSDPFGAEEEPIQEDEADLAFETLETPLEESCEERIKDRIPAPAFEVLETSPEEPYGESSPRKTPSTTQTRPHPLGDRGNLFVVCIGCASVILFTTNTDTVRPIKNGPELANAIALSACKSCSTTLSRSYATNLYLSPALFINADILTVPRLLVGVEVPLATKGDDVKFVGFDELKQRLPDDSRAKGVKTGRIESRVEDMLLPFVPRRWM